MEDYEAGGEEADLPSERLVPVDVPHQLHHGPGGVLPTKVHLSWGLSPPPAASRRATRGRPWTRACHYSLLVLSPCYPPELPTDLDTPAEGVGGGEVGLVTHQLSQLLHHRSLEGHRGIAVWPQKGTSFSGLRTFECATV